MKGIPAFAARFTIVAMFWWAHARWRKRCGIDDCMGTVLSLCLVFLILIYVYPLKMLFGTFFGFLRGGVLPYRIASTMHPNDVRSIFIIYAAGFIALSFCLFGLYLHALQSSDALKLDEVGRLSQPVPAD